ncbi:MULTISPECIES: DUF7344 domain-containing protein [Halorussus]|uniref:DUF7344 domain-containing protein n=1 Tax=Halorussus TaxID=1070314 RepID=UPI00209E0AAF|nr:hypothetical protein [Halorussus vallis]USZ74851.1 hypothetical protein NGM07_15585 [Halorussus vallis]
MDEDPSKDRNTCDASRATESRSGTLRSDDPAETILELNEVFAAISHPRRRYLLYTLINGSCDETLAELATKIAAWERDEPLADVSDEDRRDVQVSLYHSHVPKLADLGILTYERSDDIIVRAENTAQVQAVLDGAGAEVDARQEDHARNRRQDE